jgi:hypothetical protein
MSAWDDADRDEPRVPMFTDGLLAAIEERRNDKAFMARLEANIAKYKIPVGTDNPELIAAGAKPLPGAGPIHLESNFGGITVYICNDCGALYSHALRQQHEPCPTTRTT